MLFRTHVVITLFFILLFFPNILNPLIFIPVAIFAAIIPDIDSPTSKIGHHLIFRPLNFFTKHRGIIHSFSFLFLISILIFFSYKEILIPFVFGYSLHLFLDAITIQGIIPFYPAKIKIRGRIKTGGIAEIFIFSAFVLADLYFLFKPF
ncbi:LexA-binding, inner membrane-associated putative hydrolase [uncultured archaeon]|nr:LexA-binding, inner membrane-associated putative hydrolase [uncultured archaeon]